MIEHILRASLERNLIVTIIYKSSESISKRDIKVKKIEGDTVEAFCFLRKSIRKFKLSNILSASLKQNIRIG